MVYIVEICVLNSVYNLCQPLVCVPLNCYYHYKSLPNHCQFTSISSLGDDDILMSKNYLLIIIILHLSSAALYLATRHETPASLSELRPVHKATRRLILFRSEPRFIRRPIRRSTLT